MIVQLLQTWRLFWLHVSSRRRVKWYVLGFASAGILLSMTVITLAIVLRPDIPDPDTADIKTTLKFMQTDEFIAMDSQERGEFVEVVMKRYSRMKSEDKQAARKLFNDLGKQGKRRVEKRMGIIFLRNRSQEYQTLPPQAKEKYLDNFLNQAEMMSGGPDRAKARHQRHKQRRKNTARRDIKRAKNTLREVLRTTTAEERSGMARTVGDIFRRANNRYGDQ